MGLGIGNLFIQSSWDDSPDEWINEPENSADFPAIFAPRRDLNKSKFSCSPSHLKFLAQKRAVASHSRRKLETSCDSRFITFSASRLLRLRHMLLFANVSFDKWCMTNLAISHQHQPLSDWNKIAATVLGISLIKNAQDNFEKRIAINLIEKLGSLVYELLSQTRSQPKVSQKLKAFEKISLSKPKQSSRVMLAVWDFMASLRSLDH